MAIIGVKRYRLKTTIGPFDITIVFDDALTSGNHPYTFSVPGFSFEGSITNAYRNEGYTGPFSFVGQTAAQYPVSVGSTASYIHTLPLGNNRDTRIGSGGYSGDNYFGAPVWYAKPDFSVIGPYLHNLGSRFTDVTRSAPSTGAFGYYLATQTRSYQDTFFFYSASYYSEGYNTLLDIIQGGKEVVTNPDPYEPGNESETGGGTGDFDDTSDDIDIPPLPTIGATNTGFITLFNPTLSQLQALANYMWANPLFDITQWRKIFADPMQAILGLSIVPVAVPDGGLLAVTVGNISTGVSMTKAASQYVEVDCGTLNVNEYWGAYLDYDPFTKAEIYLPYCGIHPLAVDDIMGKAVHVVYHVDILSGACCAYVKCGGSVLYSFVGQCASSIPITGDNYTNVINGVMSIAGSVGSMIATGGMSAPMALGNIASTAVNSMKPSIERSGAMGGTGGLMAIQKPYIVLTRPRQALPAEQNKYMGYPSFITVNLGELEGYTEVESIHLENIPATGAELSELETILKTGVIF